MTKVSETELKLSIPIPTDIRTPYLAVNDIGKFYCISVRRPFLTSTAPGGLVLGILKDPQTYIGADVKAASEFLSPREFVATINEVLSTKGSSIGVTVDELDLAGFESIKGKVWEELWLNMSTFTVLYGTICSRILTGVLE